MLDTCVGLEDIAIKLRHMHQRDNACVVLADRIDALIEQALIRGHIDGWAVNTYLNRYLVLCSYHDRMVYLKTERARNGY